MSSEVMRKESSSVRSIVAGAAFTALTAVGAYISIPIGPVPIVLQNFFVLLAGMLLGPLRGTSSIAVYLLIGAIGLPVFAGGTGGIAHFFGPTGGFLIGFLPAAYLAGVLPRIGRARFGKKSAIAFDIFATAAAAASVYVVGVPWLKAVTEMSWSKSVGIGVLPFLPGDAIKVLAAVFTARRISSRFESFLGER